MLFKVFFGTIFAVMKEKKSGEKKLGRREKKIIERPPIVAVLGHIDHGKTRLLDAIRETKVLDSEAGGITQSIGAYEINHQGKKITFIDTPGHQAFIAMRSHGARVADLAILVVAADDGPKEQTWESFKIIQEAQTPFLVAINKIDKPEAEVERTKKQLAEGGIYLEGYGGDIPSVEVSAKQKAGLAELLDLVVLMAQMLELKADSEALASGFVLESHLDPQRGRAASLIIKNGVLSKGGLIYTNSTKGKIKILEDFLERPINKASFSSPVMVVGFEQLPEVGEEFASSLSEKELENWRLSKEKREIKEGRKENFSLSRKGEEEIGIVLKAKTLGPLEALNEIIKNIQKDFEKIRLKVVKRAVGDISEEDIKVLGSSKAVIIGFDVGERSEIDFFLKKQEIIVIRSQVIYEIEKKLRERLKLLLEEKESAYSGTLEVLAIFSQRKNEQLLGGVIQSGGVKSNQNFEIFRDEEKTGLGFVKSLRREKTKVVSAKEGEECGLLVESKIEIKKGDLLKFLKQRV